MEIGTFDVPISTHPFASGPVTWDCVGFGASNAPKPTQWVPKVLKDAFTAWHAVKGPFSPRLDLAQVLAQVVD
ncbi:hypothetical protein GCM10027598_41950 [Amycolatopsis oliviviridis]|uniref:Uncharacterized protein n=1 Tax=Amycolatopsis oliviviridis TaxID=1471590 RepID=A0ABQ3LK20_9PSEU|nr:hypothetical protein GCM10017790_19890 [Amycolatopsis oliviviridis]